MSLQTIILAPGNGTRSRPYTETVPKAMLRVGPDLYQEALLQKTNKGRLREYHRCSWRCTGHH